MKILSALFLLLSFKTFANPNTETLFDELKYALEANLVYQDDQYNVEQKALLLKMDNDYCSSILKIVERAADPMGVSFVRTEHEINWGRLPNKEQFNGVGHLVTIAEANIVEIFSENEPMLFREYVLKKEWDFFGGNLVTEYQMAHGPYNLKFKELESAEKIQNLMKALIMNCL